MTYEIVLLTQSFDENKPKMFSVFRGIMRYQRHTTHMISGLSMDGVLYIPKKQFQVGGAP